MASRGEFGVRYSTLDTDSDREQPFAAPGPNAGLSYEDLSNRVASSVTQINSNVASLQRLFKQTSKAVPGSRYHVQLSSVQKTTTDLVKLTSENMHRMEGVSTASMSAATKKRHVLHLERLRANFKKALSKFNAMTKAIVDREREAIGEVRRNVSLTQGGIQEDDIDDADDAVEDEKLLQSRQALEQQAEQDAINHQAVRQREAALRALENDILDVNDIFRDLSQMVHEQGTVVDHIEGNIDATAVEVEAAGTALKLGARYQNRSTAALDVVKRDVTDFCKTLSEDTTNYMQGNAETPFGEPKGSVQSSRAPGEFPAAQTEAARDSVLDVPTYNCQQTKLDSIQSNPDTYSKPPDSMAEFDKWCAEFDFDRHSTEIAQLLIKQNIRSLHAKLVPIQVSYRDFWLRYFYQVHLMDKDTERRAALRAFADQAVQNTMDDWSDGDGWDGADDDWQPTTTSKSSSMTLPVTRTPQTTSTSSLISTDLASTPTQATVTVASATASALVSPDADARGQYSYAGSAKKHADSRPPTLSKAEEVKGTSTGSNALRQTDGGGFQRQISTDASSPLSSSSEPSSPTTSPALSPHSTNKPISSRSRRVRPVAHQKLRPGQSLPSTASSTECHSQKRRKPSDSKPGMPTISSSSSLADDEEVDSQDTDISLQHVPTLQSVQDSLLDVTDETSGSEIVVLGTGEGCQSPPRRMTPSRSVITSTRRAQYPGASLSAIASPPPSSACSEFELISEPEPLDATSSAQRTHQAAASIASPVALHSSPLSLLTTTVSTTTSTGSQPAMAVSSNSTLKAVGNAAVVSTTTVATEAAAGGSEEDWESWD